MLTISTKSNAMVAIDKGNQQEKTPRSTQHGARATKATGIGKKIESGQHVAQETEAHFGNFKEAFQ